MDQTASKTQALHEVLEKLASSIAEEQLTLTEAAEIYLTELINHMPIDYRDAILDRPENGCSRNLSIRENAANELRQYEHIKIMLIALTILDEEHDEKLAKYLANMPSCYSVIMPADFSHFFDNQRLNHNFEFQIKTQYEFMTSEIYTERIGRRKKKRLSGYLRAIETFSEIQTKRYYISDQVLLKLKGCKGITTNAQLYRAVYNGEIRDPMIFSTDEIREIENYIYTWIDMYYFIIQQM